MTSFIVVKTSLNNVNKAAMPLIQVGLFLESDRFLTGNTP